jgi:hypothetical protein
MRAQLAKWKVAAEHGQAGITECGRKRYKQWRLTVCSRAMGKNQAIAGWILWNMKKSANRRCSQFVNKRKYAGLAHRNSLVGCSRENRIAL